MVLVSQPASSVRYLPYLFPRVLSDRYQQNQSSRGLLFSSAIEPYAEAVGQTEAGGAIDAHTPTPPAACDRNALSAL